LGAIQSRDSGFSVNRQHQGIIRWVQKEPDYFDYLVGEMKIAADFEGLQAMGLRSEAEQTCRTCHVVTRAYLPRIRTAMIGKLKRLNSDHSR